METEKSQILLRLPAELKASLQREAAVQGRKVTQEIVIRLTESLKVYRTGVPANYSTERKTAPLVTGDVDGPAPDEMEQALLTIFRRFPPEKQLAFLTLFK